MKSVTLFLIETYQKYVSPHTRPSCRFFPTCSEYTRQAVSKYGTMRGLWLGARRVSRCHPFNAGGFDPLK